MTNKPILMKGDTWTKQGHRQVYPAIVEAKYDGIRARISLTPEHGVEVESYARKPLYNVVDHRAMPLRHWMRDSGVTELDLEVLVNGSFNDTYRYVRSHSVPKGLENADFQFILLDLPSLESTYDIRRLRVQEMAEEARVIYNLNVIAPWHTHAYNEDDVWDAYQSLRLMGLEGAMVKTKNHLYQRKRSRDWLKLKPSDTADGKIINVNRAVSKHGEPLDRAGSITVLLEDGSIAQPAAIAHALGADMFHHPEKYIGRWVEFQFMERDRAGGYRHPFFIRFREDKQ